jgi:hypothetical protein
MRSAFIGIASKSLVESAFGGNSILPPNGKKAHAAIKSMIRNNRLTSNISIPLYYLENVKYNIR